MRLDVTTAVKRFGEANWLTEERSRAYGKLIGLMVLIQAVNQATRIIRSSLNDSLLRPEPTDFDAFWAAAHLSALGQAARVYNPLAMQAAEAIGAQQAPGQFFPYLNPPVFLLLCLPLALLPYLAAMAAFIAAGYAAVVTCLRRLLPPAWPLTAVLALPAAMLNGTEGQNGSLSATCYAGAMLLLDTYPVAAGACLGVLAFKPHLALAVPVGLIAARRWSAFAGAAVCALALVLASWLLLGSGPWLAFSHSGPAMRAVLDGDDTWPRMLSTYAAIRTLHGGQSIAYGAQAIVAIVCLFCLAMLARTRPGAGAEVAGIVAASLLSTPYLLDYDLVCAAVPMAWLASSGSLRGWAPWEKLLLGVLYLYPLEARNLNLVLHAPIAPLLFAALLALILRRCRALLLATSSPATTGHTRWQAYATRA